MQLKPEFLINSEDELRAHFPPTHPIAIAKNLDRLDKHAKDYLKRAPFFCIGTQTPDGAADVSPRGDPRGFVKTLNDKTLLIPDRPGNNRLDTLSNILANPSVGLLFMVPGFDETLRINGTAKVSRDPELCGLLKVNDRAPSAAIIVSVREVYLHCAKAFRRAKLWDPDQHQERGEMPSLMHMMLDQTTGAPKNADERQALDAKLEESYQNSMY